MTSRFWQAGGSGLLYPLAAAAVFNPASLFGANDRGIIIDFSDKTKLFQDSAGTVPVANPGDPIGYVKDLGPLGKNATQATSTKRPLWWGVPRQLGTELLANGRFADTSTWVLGTGWNTIDTVNNKCLKTAGTASTLSQGVSPTAGQAYLVFYSIRDCSAGSVQLQLTGGTTVSGLSRTANGSYVDFMVAQSGNNTFAFSASSTFNGSIYSVTMKPVTAWTNMGAYFDGAATQLKTASVDLSNSQQATVSHLSYYAEGGGFRDVAEFGNYLSSTAGSILIQYASNPDAFLRGATASCDVAGLGGPVTTDGRLMLGTYAFDTTAATVAGAVQTRSAGINQTGTATGSAPGTTNMANGPVTLGSAANNLRFWKDREQRFCLINRTLTGTELASLEGWIGASSARVAVIGDSTSAADLPGNGVPFSRSTSSLVGGLVVGVCDVSTVGDKIDDQLTKFNAIADKSALQAVIVQIGLNDCNTYGGQGTKTNAQIIADYQALITAIRAAVPATCLIYLCAMTPAKGWLGATTTPATAYSAWQALNQAIMGGGATPITDANCRRINGHVAALNDGNDNLAPAYDGNGDKVHPSTEGRFVIGGYWRSQAEADGLLLAA